MAFGYEEEDRPPIWTVVLAVFVALAWSVANFAALVKELAPMAREPDGVVAILGAIAGHALIPAVVVWMVAFALFWRRAIAMAPLYLLVIYAAVCLGNFGAFQAVKASAGRLDAANVATQHAIAADVEALQGQVATDHAAYLAELKAMGFPAVLTPGFAQSDPHRRKALARLHGMHALIPKYRSLAESRVDGLLAKVKALPAGDARDSFLKGFANTEDQSRARLNQMWSLEEHILTEYEKAVQTLARSEGRWVVRGDNFLFADAATLATWRAHLAEAKSLGEQEQRLVAADAPVRQKLAEDLKQMREAAPAP
jgi:hypothetical protein